MNTFEKLNAHLSPAPRTIHLTDGEPWLKVTNRITCADGFSLSVQASRTHYCSPRDNDGPWASVEIGFPSERVDSFMEYIDGGEDTDPTSTVYGYVPVYLVVEAIDAHGGFAP